VVRGSPLLRPIVVRSITQRQRNNSASGPRYSRGSCFRKKRRKPVGGFREHVGSCAVMALLGMDSSRVMRHASYVPLPPAPPHTRGEGSGTEHATRMTQDALLLTPPCRSPRPLPRSPTPRR